MGSEAPRTTGAAGALKSLLSRLVPHEGHSGVSLESTSNSNSLEHSSHWYSKIGMTVLARNIAHICHYEIMKQCHYETGSRLSKADVTQNP